MTLTLVYYNLERLCGSLNEPQSRFFLKPYYKDKYSDY